LNIASVSSFQIRIFHQLKQVMAVTMLSIPPEPLEDFIIANGGTINSSQKTKKGIANYIYHFVNKPSRSKLLEQASSH